MLRKINKNKQIDRAGFICGPWAATNIIIKKLKISFFNSKFQIKNN